MSFSKDVKTELSHCGIEKDCCAWAEIVAFMLLRGELKGSLGSGWRMEITADHPAVARRIYRLMKQNGQGKPQVWMINGRSTLKKGWFKVHTYLREKAVSAAQMLLLRRENGDFLPELYQVFNRKCCRKALLRTAFICRGFVTPPEKSYHLEMLFPNADMTQLIHRAMKKMDMEAKIIERRGGYQLYVKDGDKICHFLKLIGATRAALEYENMRVLRSVKNDVNRQVNCETANLEKAVAAAVRQKELIERFIDCYGLESFPTAYRELARMRVDFYEDSLQELGNRLNPPLSKSGVAYRMRRIEAFARERLEETGEPDTHTK